MVSYKMNKLDYTNYWELQRLMNDTIRVITFIFNASFF